MFIRQKRNNSKSISIQIIDKSSGKYKVLKTIGSSKDSKVIEQLIRQAQLGIDNIQGQQRINFNSEKEKD